MSEWKEYKLGDIATFSYGKMPKSSFIGKGDFCLYTGYKYTDKYPFCSCNIGDVILVARGVGGTGDVKLVTKDCYLTNLSIKIDLNNHIIDNKFFYYLHQIENLRYLDSGSAQSQITINDLSNVILFLPPLTEQKRIVSILSSLDDKIDLLHHENETLEAMAETLFRKWFIEDAKDEWEEKSLAYVSDITAGGDKPKIFSKYITSECTIPVYSNGIDNEGLYGYTNIPKIYKESITVSARGTIGYVVLRRSPYVPIVRLISLIPKDNIVTAKWLYLYLKQLNINGTGTTQQQLTIPDFCSRTIILPPFEIIKKFTNIIDNLYDKQLINKEDISCIEKMKNCLLKKLMHNK